jgi:hypothetical protein
LDFLHQSEHTYGVSVGLASATATVGAGVVTVGVTPACKGTGGKISRITAIPIRIIPIPNEKKRGYFPTGGIFIADISNPPPRRPIKKKIAPMKSKTPISVCGMMIASGVFSLAA